MLHFKIFDRGFIERSPVTGVVLPRDLNYLKRVYTLNRDQIAKYYLERNFAVKNTHIFSRLVEQFPLLLSDELIDFIRVSKDTLTYLGKNYGFVSALNRGKVQDPYFYGNKGSSIIIDKDDYFNPFEFRRQWRTASCVEVLTHPRNDTRLLLPFGIDDGSQGGLSVIAVNLLKLAIKYREFIQEQDKNRLSGESVLVKNNFIAKYVLPGFLENDIDHRLLNMVMDRFYGVPTKSPIYKHKFVIFEPHNNLNRYIDDTLNRITSTNLNFLGIMFNISLIFKVNMADLLALDGYPDTLQLNWALVASRLKYMCFLYDVAKDKGMSSNFIGDWKLLVTRLERNSAMSNAFPPKEAAEIRRYIEKIKDM